MYYIDLADEFSSYFSNLPGDFDLFITHVNAADTQVINDKFSSCGANAVVLKMVDNVGRDVLPLFKGLQKEIHQGGYEVIGHFHSKKSAEISEDKKDFSGDVWREFLLETLIGDENNASQVLAAFNDRTTGLVIPEDRHCVDMGENQLFADTLCEAMKIEKMQFANIFPLGTMFWARTRAIAPLFKLDWDDFIEPEPLPNDGSYMHAVERVLSQVCLSTKYDLKSVSKNLIW